MRFNSIPRTLGAREVNWRASGSRRAFASTGDALFVYVQTTAIHPRPAGSRQRPKQRRPLPGARLAAAEIHAYIATRDLLLEAAETDPSVENLLRAGLANEVVASSLARARSPYEAQCLPESDAKRERQRCVHVDLRIAQLSRERRGKKI